MREDTGFNVYLTHVESTNTYAESAFNISCLDPFILSVKQYGCFGWLNIRDTPRTPDSSIFSRFMTDFSFLLSMKNKMEGTLLGWDVV